MRLIISRAVFRTLDGKSPINDYKELPFVPGTASLTIESSMTKAGEVTNYTFSAVIPLNRTAELQGNLVVKLFFEPHHSIELGCYDRPARFSFSNQDRVFGTLEYSVPEQQMELFAR